MELGGTEQQLIFLNTHWGTKYDFTAPKELGGKWTAKATFGEHGELEASTSAELLAKVRSHYQASGGRTRSSYEGGHE
jgi:hypothetical protein